MKTKCGFFHKSFSNVFFYSLIISILFMSYTQSFGQESQPSEKTLTEEAKKRGYSAEQLKSMGIDLSNPQQAIEKARQMGISETQIQAALKQQQSPAVTEETIVTSEISEDKAGDIIEEEDEYKEGEDELDVQLVEEGRFYGLAYYGYDIFQKAKGSVGPIEIGPIDPGYPIGAGDVLRLTVWGEVEFQYELEVNREGNIVITKAGQIFVAGTRLERLRETLKNYLSKFYSGLANDPPTIFMDITIARLRSNQIFIMGEVDRPGSYAISSYSTAFNALYAVGGPKLTGSLREVRILREGKVITRVDLYDYLLKGVSTEDKRLQNNDIVFVPPRKLTVGIKGEILRPAVYELTEKETLKNLVELAAGLTSSAYTFRTQIDRIIPFEKRVKGIYERELLDIDIDAVLKGKEIVQLYDGDIITIFPITDVMVNYVDIEGGGIVRPGRYELNDRIVTLSDLVEQADGLTGDVYLSRADIIRVRDDFKEEFVRVNLENALLNEPGEDLRLKRWDRIHIYSQHELEEIPTVTLSGFVKNPGTYPLPENMTLYDLLFKYSGLQDSLRFARTFTERGDIYRLTDDAKTRYIKTFNLLDLWEKKSGENILLHRGDEVVLYEKNVIEVYSKTIVLNGAVKNPGTYELKENMVLSDLILAGGGFTENASVSEAEVARFPFDGIPGETIAEIIMVPIIETKNLPGNLEFVSSDILTRNTKAASFYLIPNDQVFIRTNPEYRTAKSVFLTGEVIKPGTYILEKQNEKLSEIIDRAGGLKPIAYLGGGQLFRKELRVNIDFEKAIKKKSKKDDIILLDGDRILIPPKPNSVFLTGEVINPGFYKYIPGMKVKEYLRYSGGKTENGDKIYIQEPSGRTKIVGFFGNIKIKDGSIITVYPKPPEEKKEEIDWSQTIKDTFALMSSAMMIIYLSQQVK